MPKQVIALDASKIRSVLTCEEQFKLHYVENLRKTNLYLDTKHRYADKGTLVHELLAIFYTLRALQPKVDRWKHSRVTWNLFKKNKLIEKAGFDKEFEQLVYERFMQYMAQHSLWDFVPLVKNGVVGVETPFAVRLYEDDDKIFILEGRIDLLGYDSRGNGFCDHKTQERIGNLYERKIQFLCYALASTFNHGTINYFGLAKDYKAGMTLRRKLLYIPQDHIDWWKDYLITQVYPRMYDLSYGIKKFARNPNACAGDFEKFQCPYTMICESFKDKERQELIKKQFYEVVPRWSPWGEDEDEREEENE